MDDISQIIFELGEHDEFNSKPVVPPIYQSSNFAFERVNDLRNAFRNEANSTLYTRGNNPTTAILRKKIAALANADDALIVSSGASAISLAILANVSAGDHILCIKEPYNWTEKFCRVILSKFNVSSTFASADDTNEFLLHIKENTKVIFIESPNTFTYEILDIAKVVLFAKERGITTIIDNTYATPLGQRCIEMGVDIEIHSISKYLNGHSDVVAGTIISNQAMIDKIYKSEFLNIGAIISPHDAWLILRGLRTLPIRIKAIGETVQSVIEFLRNQPWVNQVLHPFESDFHNQALAKSQMNWHGGLFSILVDSDSIEKIEQFCERLNFFKMAVSWGGHESLIIPACAFYDRDYDGKRKYPINLLRLYIGLEHKDTLIADLSEAAKVFDKK
jgi:cystathionine beta-lyase/cystathionine gamma-synthase